MLLGHVFNVFCFFLFRMQRNEERNKARIARERHAVGPVRSDNQPDFSVVRHNNSNSNDANELSNIFGCNYDVLFANRLNLDHFVGVDQQPATPAPSHHVHDPDSYPTPIPSASHHHSNGGQRLSAASNNASRSASASTSMKPPSTNHIHKSNGEIKTMPKTGPGPDPGGGGGGIANSGHNLSSSQFSNSSSRLTNGQGFKSSMARTNGSANSSSARESQDPEIDRVMSEMTNITNPLSGIVTPQRDSSFSFPVPLTPITPLKDTPVKLRKKLAELSSRNNGKFFFSFYVFIGVLGAA